MFPQITSRLLNSFIAVAIVLCGQIHAQIIINLQAPPPFQFKIEHMWKLTLMNPTQTTFRVYLFGSATERRNGRIVEATTTTFSLPPGLKLVNPRELAPLDVKESNYLYSDVVKNIGTVRSGDYDICVSVYNAADNMLLGETCVQSPVLNLTQIELLQPDDAAMLSIGAAIPAEQPLDVKRLVRSIPDGMDSRYILRILLRATASREALPSPSWGNYIAKFGDTPDNDNDPATEFSNSMNAEAIVSALRSADNPGPIVTAVIVRSNLRSWMGCPPTCPPRFLDIEHKASSDDDAMFEKNLAVGQSTPGGIITFSWLPPSPLPPQSHVTYTLRITEILGRQSPYDAIHSNPASIVLPNIATNMAQLPVAARRLKPGSTYAWQVAVNLNGVLLQKSEVRSFTMQVSAGEFQLRMTGHPPGLMWIPYDASGMEDKPQKPDTTKKKEKSNVIRDNPFMHAEYDPTVTSNGKPPQIQTERAVLYASLNTDPEYLLGAPINQFVHAPAAKPFSFIGSASFSAQYADRAGSYSEMPKNHLTADLRPGIALYGVPFGGNFQYSTLQDANRQSINSFGINFDFEGMRQGLESRLIQSVAESEQFSSLNPDQLSGIGNASMLAGNLEQFSSISGAEKLFMNIRSLGIGTNYPSYSEYVLNGVPVTGLNMEFNPGIVYAALTASQNQRPIDNTAYRRNLYAGRLGVGKKEGMHLYFTGLYVSDDPASIRVDSSNMSLTPRENYVVGAHGVITLFEEHLSLEGEGAASLLTRDTRDTEFASSAIPGFVKDLANPRISSSVDFMYSGKITYTNRESATKVSAGLKMIGPGYASLGVPNLRTDQFGYEAKLDQQLFSRRLTIVSFFRMYNDNLIDWKSSKTTMTAYGVNLGLNIPRLPYVRISYSPITQKNDATDPLAKFETNMTMMMAMMGYSYSIGGVFASTSLSYSGQQTEMLSAAGNYRSNSYMLSEMLNFSLPLSIGINLGLIESRTSAGYGMIRTVDLNASAPLGDIVTVGLGVTVALERDKNERLGFHANTMVNLTDGLALDLRLERTNYNDFLLGDSTYREFLATGTLLAGW